MNNLVRIATKQKVTWFFQCFKHQRELGDSQILHLINNNKIVPGSSHPFMSNKIQVKQFLFNKPLSVFFKEIIEFATLFFRKDRLANTKQTILLPTENTFLSSRNDSTNLLKCLMSINTFKGVLYPEKPR